VALTVASRPATAGPPWPADVPPADHDDDPAAGASSFWQRTLDPLGPRYDNLVELASRQLADSDRAQRELGEATLRDAIALDPDRPAAHVWLGRALAQRGEHAACAASLQTAFALEPGFQATGGEWPASFALELELGLCQARSGGLEAAERTFATLVERGVEEAVVLERLADARMALGRLDDARIALERARRAAPMAASPEFGLAVAHDREEDGEAARRHLAIAVGRDGRLASLAAGARPYAPLDDEHYYLGLALAHLGDGPRALFHFRRYLAGREGPWTPRARVHLESVRGDALGGDLAARGSASVDLDRARKALAAADRGLQACVDRSPTLLLRVAITRTLDGGAGGDAAAVRPGVRVTVVEQHGLKAEALRAVVGCVEEAAAKVALPRPDGPKGTFVTLEFSVIAR
jgi:tetratricopeptide (TPR) repeat protein